MIPVALSLMLVVALESQEPAPASAPVHKGYVQGTVLVTTQPAGVANHRVSPPLGGHATGIAASAGLFVAPIVSIEGEVVLGGSIAAPQRFSYDWREDYIAEHRDLLVNVNLRSRPGGPRWPELVIGGGLAIARTRRLSRVSTYSYDPSITFSAPDYTGIERGINIGGGIDMPIPLNSRIALVPSFRYRWVPRRAEGESDYRGVAGEVYEISASLRSRIESRRPASGPPPRHGYVQAALVAATHPAGAAADRVEPALGGHSTGIAASAGRFMNSDLPLEGELVLGGTVSMPQHFSYPWLEDYVADTRHRLFNGNLRWKPAGTSPVEVVLGGGLASNRIRKRSVVATRIPGSLTPAPSAVPDRTQVDNVLNLTGGLDAPVALTAKIAVVPNLRVRWLNQRDSGLGTELGVGKYSYQFGASLRVADPNGKPHLIRFSDVSVPTILYVFTPACSWCARNKDNVQAMYAGTHGRFRMIGLSLTDAGLNDYIAQHAINFEAYVIPDSVRSQLKLGGTPQTLLVGQNGTLQKNWRGAYQGRLKSDIESALDIRMPGLSLTPATKPPASGRP
jgi:hypothetical protein